MYTPRMTGAKSYQTFLCRTEASYGFSFCSLTPQESSALNMKACSRLIGYKMFVGSSVTERLRQSAQIQSAVFETQPPKSHTSHPHTETAELSIKLFLDLYGVWISLFFIAYSRL